MPTLNNDSPAIVVNPAKKRNRRILLTIFLALFASMALAPTDASASNLCVMVTVLPPATTNWSDTTRWLACGGGYPGQSGSGDTASVIGLFGTTLNVDVPLNSVKLQIDGSIPVQIPSGSNLTLENSSTATSSNTFTVGGGTMGTASGAAISGFQGNVIVNGGTFNSAGTIAFTSGQFTFNGGSLTGSGTISASTALFTGTLSPMSISSTTFNDTGFLSYSTGLNALTLSSGASINVLGGSTFSLQTDAPINGSAAESINIASGGSMKKTSGTSSNVISCFVKNDGTVDASVGGTGGFGFSGNGTHSGSFIAGSGAPTVFAGNNTFNAGASFSGGNQVKIAGGTQTFNASVAASSGLKWAGGTIAGTGPLTVPSSLVFDGSISAMTLTGVIQSTAAISYAPSNISNLLTINGAAAMLETTTPGSLSIAGDFDILASPAGAGKLRVSGTANVSKTSGSTGSSIYAFVDNSASTVANNATGPLNLAGGGQSTGTVSVPSSGNVINVTGGTFTSTGAFSGNGTINVAGGTLNVNTATTFSAPTLAIKSGTFGGSGAITLLGPTTWSGGTITGTSSFTISPATGSLSLTGANGPMTLDGRTITNNSTLNYTSSSNNLTLMNGATIQNNSSFNASGSGTISTDGTATAITNSGTFTKSSSGLFQVNPAFNAGGSGVIITGGVVDVEGTGTSSSSFTMSAGTEVWFPTPFASTYTWATGTTFAGGKVTIDGSGTVATSAPLTINNTNLEVNGGIFSTPFTFTVTTPATLKWTSGTLSGAGHTAISAGTTLDLTNEFGPRSMSGHTIDNGGTTTLSGAVQPVSLDNGSSFNNTGTLDIQSDGSMPTNGIGTNTFSNSGIVKKSAGGSGFRFDVPYNQTGGSTDANSASAGSTIIFNNGGSMTFGILKATQASNFVDFFNGAFNVSGGTFNSGTSGPIRINGAGATLNINAPVVTTSFVQNAGTLQGSGNLNVGVGTYTWNGGTMTGPALLIVASGGTLDVAGGSITPLVLNSHTINNSGTITYHPLSGGQSNQLTLQGTGSIANQSGGLLNLTDNSSILAIGSATTIVNSGTIQSSGSSSIAPTVTNNAGALIKPTAGTLTLLSGSSNGILDAASPAAINFGSGSAFTVSGGTWGGSGGGFWVTGGDVTFSAPFSLSGLALNSGQIDGGTTLTLTGANAWGGGTMAGSGTTANSGTLTMSNTGNSFLNTRTFTNNGTVNYQNGGGSLQLVNGATLTNTNLFDVQGDVSLSCNCAVPGLFHNTGVVQKSAGTGSAVISAPFNNDGSVNDNFGILQFTAAGTHNGAFFAGSNATVSFIGANTFNAPSSLSGATISFGGGSSTVNSGTIVPSTLTVNGASVTINAAASLDTLNVHNAAFLGGTGTITVNGTTPLSEWSGGTLGGTGTLTINTGAQMQIDGLTAAMTLNGRPLLNLGTLNYTSTSNSLLLTNAVLTNGSGGMFNVDDSVGIGTSGTSSISNIGTMQRSTAGTEVMSPPVTNTGTIKSNAGQLLFNGGLTQSAGSTTLTGGSIGSPLTIALAGGSLTGSGNVFAGINNSGGTVAPGTPALAGTITFSGHYTQGAGGSTNIKLGGTAPGTTYDVVDASPSLVTLAGNLNVTLFNSFVPTGGNTFDVLKFATRSGDFSNYNLPTFAGGGNFLSSYLSGPPDLLRLTAVVTQSDLGITQSAPTTVLHGQNNAWTLTVTNGPTPVTNVVVTDTFANATFVSATSVGPCTPSGSTVTCNIGSLAANQSVNVNLILNANALATISNSATVTQTEFDPNTANNSVGPAFTTVLNSADLSLANVASSNPVNAGSALSFALTITNAGPDATSSPVSISNTFPAGVTSFGFSGTGWSCGALTAGMATCSTTVIVAASGSAAPLILSMTAPASGPAVDSATVSSGGDPNGTNNSASQSVTVVAQSDLTISKSGPASVNAGQNIVYTVVVTNNGPSTATGVSVADSTPAGLTFVSNTGACTTPYPCALGTFTNGQSATIISTYATSSGSAGTTVVNSATVSAVTADPAPTGNVATKTTIINGSADVSITKLGPSSATPGSPFVYTITVTNNGPSDAAAVVVTDPTPSGTTFVSNSGACTTAFPCNLGIVVAGQTKTITSTFTTPAGFTGTTVTNSATVTSTTSDPNASNNSATVTTTFGSTTTADLSIVKTGPQSATTGTTATYTLTIFNNGPATATGVVVNDPTPIGLTFVANSGNCTGAFPCNLGNLASGQSATITASYTVTATSGSVTNTANISAASTDPNPANDVFSATTLTGTTACVAQPPSLVSPANGSTVSSPVTFSWTAVPGATGYNLFAAIGGASTQQIGSTTTGTSLTLPISGGNVIWSVQALGVTNCSQLLSANGTFNVCGAAPLISVVGTSSSGQSYTVQWSDTGVTNYELQESATEAFDNPQTFPVTGTSRAFTKSATVPTAFFYRVRSLTACGQGPGPYSASERVVIVPIPVATSQGPSATVDINNKHVVIQTVFIPGQGAAIAFNATTDEPWLTVTPSSGILPAAGTTLSISADPADLPNGTFTATLILTFPGALGRVSVLDVKPPVTVPISISVVTPVSPASASTPSANSLIIPSVGHLDGIDSQWRSDVRITNTSLQKINYLLRFTPAGGDATQVKQTQVSIASNDTMALDDIVKNWYGVGALGDAANGVLEVRPLNTSGKGAPDAEDVNVSFVTIASSRTFNQSAGGTLGQYIPAIPFASFIGKVSGDAQAGILSMQQIVQSAAYRTNLGIVEASGKAVSVLISVFDTSGKNLLDLPLDLKGGEQKQLNSFLAANNISLTDGRIEVKVTAGDGKITAYASVVDNETTDPLLVTGVPLVQNASRSFVIPGVADITNDAANWRSDLRIFNSGTDPQYVTMTLYPQTGSASSDTLSRSLTINPGEVSVLDNILASRFGVSNIGGAMHIDTLTDSNLVVTGRTYNQVSGGGTYGQFIAAVTPADGVGKGDRTLNVLQVEDSTRYRTNLGIAEVTGQPVTVEVAVFLPDAKVAPKVTIPLAANEYRQFRVLQQLGVGTAYNARITIRVIDGAGKITAYGSVIDMQTQDPTYVPAQ